MASPISSYAALGSSPASATTLSAGTAPGATTCTVVSGTGYATGATIQLDAGVNAEVVTLTNVAGTTLTFAGTPVRLAHSSGAAVAAVSAPFYSLSAAAPAPQAPAYSRAYLRSLAPIAEASDVAGYTVVLHSDPGFRVLFSPSTFAAIVEVWITDSVTGQQGWSAVSQYVTA